MANYLSAMESNMSLLQKLQKSNAFKAITGFLSLRFTASTPASISMSYSSDIKSPGRNYLEIFSLWKFYPSPEGFKDVLEPVADQSVNEYQVRISCIRISRPFAVFSCTSRAGFIGASISHQTSQPFGISNMIPNSMTVSSSLRK
jgi:hypothetical protein